MRGTRTTFASLLLATTLLVPTAVSPWGDEEEALPPEPEPEPEPRFASEVLFFYYGWYSGGASGRHWADGITDRPQAGHYDSHSVKDTRHQLSLIREAGGTGIILSWWGPTSFEERSLAVALEAGEKEGVKVTASFETWAYQYRKASAWTLAKEMEHIWHKHAQHPAWLRVDGAPVLFVHAACLHPLEKWQEALAILEKKGIRFHLYGEIRDTKDAGWMYEAFDGLYYYMPIELQKGRVYGNANREMQEHANSSKKEWLPTISPAYDNMNDRLKRHPLVVDEEDGALVREAWAEVVPLEPRFILLATWNEWNEGTSYEPGIRDGGRRLAIVKDLLAGGDGLLDDAAVTALAPVPQR